MTVKTSFLIAIISSGAMFSRFQTIIKP